MLSGAVTSRSTSKPGSIARARDCRLRTKSPAAISSSSDSATSATTSVLLQVEPRAALVAVARRILERRHQPGRDALSAGARPNSDAGERSTARARTAARARRSRSRRERQRARRWRRRAERRHDHPRQRNAGDAADAATAARSRSAAAAPAGRGSRRSPAAPRARAAARRLSTAAGWRCWRRRSAARRRPTPPSSQRDRPHLLPLTGESPRRSARPRRAASCAGGSSIRVR